MPFQLKTTFDENGRVCTCCNKYKKRKYYSKMSSGVKRKSPNCLECRNERKRAYRKKTNYAKDRDYKKRVRTLEVGTTIIILGEEQNDLEFYGTIQKWKVVKYQFKKGYTVQSKTTGYFRNIDIGDNKKSVKYISYQ